MTDHRTRTTYAIGIDPGVSTGLTILRGDGLKLHVQQGTPSQVLDDLALRFPFLCGPGADVLLGYERFVQTGDGTVRSAQPLPQQTVGVVGYVARLHGWKLYAQSPSDVKALAPNALLRDLGLWTTPRDVERSDADDANDATRHALAVLAHHRASLFDRLLRVTGM